jgi:hypothetical protein
MSTLAIAFALAWSAVAAYLAWLGVQNRHLAQRLDAVEAAAGDTPIDRAHSRAA